MTTKNIISSIIAVFAVSAIAMAQPFTTEDILISEASNFEGCKNIYVTEEFADFLETGGHGNEVALKRALVNLGFNSAERLFPAAGRFEARTRKEGLHRWYQVSCRGAVPASYLRQCGQVIVMNSTSAQNNYYNDPLLSHQTSIGSTEAGMNALDAWKAFPTAKQNEVVVAVIDGGINYNHEDLKGIYHSSYNFVRNSSQIIPDNHGTAVAGIIAANCNNGKGVSGIADGVKVMGCQVFDKDAKGQTRMGNTALAIKWACDNGAVICNNSWEYTFGSEEKAAKGSLRAADKAAIDYFVKYAGLDENGKQEGPMAGGVVFFSAGNSGYNYSWPSAYENVIAVGSYAEGGNRASISNYGDWVNLSTYVSYVSTTNNGYGVFTGTSASCAGASGLAALAVSRFGGKGFTADRLRSIMLKSSKPVAGKGIGSKVDALAALQAFAR